MDKFLRYPGAVELSRHPRIVALRDDPEIAEEIAKGKYLALLSNQSVVDAANDPELGGMLKRFELEKAIDYALGE